MTPQQKMLEVFDTVLNAITFAVAAIGALWFVLPALYAIGAWLFATRDDDFPTAQPGMG